MAIRLKTWVWIVVGVVAFCVLSVIALAGVGFYLVSQNIDTKTASADGAARQFDEVRAGFKGQKPLIELDSRGDIRKANTNRTLPDTPVTPEHLYILAFDPADGRIVRFRLPFWLLRWKAGNATIDLNGNRMDLEDLRLKIEDLERYGPTLIVDHTAPDGDRVMVWSK